ncbi:hypothetical protein [Cloacibacillus porcorum]|uniref:Uncharacterized protein n=1 Tax=Cloacibacillus porcorum TaxID=1197717 RepID=A0A1B2I201_9BACT|nr:hypothetical protein [Cloacibacillus porcorum]ANZ44011.1 hypothetical protein BED41_02225 [Cloacibacillus porcorum]
MCDGAYWLFNRNLKEIEKIEREMAKEKAEHDKWFKRLPLERRQALERMIWWDNVIVISVLFGPLVVFFLMN